jgi:primosomal protein N' (replication factor Y)
LFIMGKVPVRVATTPDAGRYQAMIVGVHPLAGFDKILHYRVPAPLQDQARVGSLVRIPILSSLRLGVIGEMGAPRDFPVEKLKSVAQLVYPFPALAPDLIALARWMAGYYAAPMDSIIETMIPAAVRRGMALRQEKQIAVARSLSAEELEKLSRRAPQQARLYKFLAGESRPQPRGLILSRLGVGSASAAALVRAGLAREESRRIVRDAYSDNWAHGERVIGERQALPAALANWVKAG